MFLYFFLSQPVQCCLTHVSLSPTAKRTCTGSICVSRGCASLSKGPGYYILNANHGTWPKNGFCRYLAVHKAMSYQLTVQLYNKIGWRGVHSGHLGIAYNAIDENNYDFVYFRYLLLGWLSSRFFAVVVPYIFRLLF